MKKILTILIVAAVFTACKSDVKKESSLDVEAVENENTAKKSDGMRTLVGQFIYYADAAVLQTKSDIYGVVINDKMHELNDMAKVYKNEPTDYVTVQIKGTLIPKPEGEEGWPFKIDIKEIDNVKKYKSNENDVIKLGDDSVE
ncbi:hypothetical protein [Psychroserpens sp.]|uniref:hypothetical protein n=1 Tax=Psychroserpens sp. TaxID=2020870 RepID=UPI00385B0BE0